MLLSIDVGIKNLAMCLIEPATKRIHQWDVSGVPPMHADGLYPCFKKHLKERPWVLQASTVLIEKQPDRNRGIKSVENFLHAYFVIHDKEVIIYDARHKIPDVVGAGRAQYTRRKKASIERARAFISAQDSNNGDWVTFFDHHKKKDDLADTVMQALSFVNRIPDKPTAPKKVAPRKPTENQKRTKYSKANLAWIVKNGAPQDARFKKDLARYYTSLNELKTEFNLT
jgi:hypothetical protein